MTISSKIVPNKKVLYETQPNLAQAPKYAAPDENRRHKRGLLAFLAYKYITGGDTMPNKYLYADVVYPR